MSIGERPTVQLRGFLHSRGIWLGRNPKTKRTTEERNTNVEGPLFFALQIVES